MEDGNRPKYGIKSTLIQIGLCIIASIAQLSSGMTMGFSAVTLPYMQQKDSYLHVTSDQASWIASLAAISIPFGCLVSGPIIDRLGRKTGLLLLNLPSFLGWLLISIQPNIHRIYLGRILTGFSSGLSSVPATVYFAEVSTKSMRGLLINGTSVSISAGVLIVYTLGYFLKDDWRMVASICSVFPVAAAIMITFLVPESPQWLISKGCNKKAHNSLKVIRGVPSTKEVEQEFESMLDPNKSNRRHKLTFKETLFLFGKPQVYKPFIIMNVFFFLQQFSGIFVVIFYAVDVVQNSGVSVDPYIVSVMIALIRLLFTISGAGLSKQLGRRPLAIFSGAGMTVSLLFLVYHLHHSGNSQSVAPIVNKTMNSFGSNDTSFGFNDTSFGLNDTSFGLNETSFDFNGTSLGINGTKGASSNQSSVSWMPVISILFYVLSSTVGFLTLPWAMIGEVFPSQVRGVAGGLVTCFAYIASFATVKSYPYLLESLQQSGVYFIFGIMALIGTIFVTFFLPETQGKTLKEIEDYFAGKGKNEQSDRNLDDFTENKIMLSTVRLPEIVSQGKSSEN